MTNPLLQDLTPAQREAVTHIHGPMLVVAGAGSGKTRVVTRRVAYLIEQGVRPWRILALTFTNKAAKEMRSRVEALVGEAPSWMGTFHSVCARLLRMDIHLVDCGRDNRFSIMDQGDQESIVKQCLKKFSLGDKSNKPSAILAAISTAKSSLIGPAEYTPGSWRDEIVAKIYAEYEAALKAANSLDFDDLLLYAVKLLQSDETTLRRYNTRFPFLLVDEYQDTNRVQYLLLKLLSGQSANLHATGDPDQSIYSWRGADYRNIMDFQNDFPGAKLVRLEQNYRSTQNILHAANQLIRNNTNRIDKDLFTENPPGDHLQSAVLQTEATEAAWVAEEIEKLQRDGQAFTSVAVFYRTNAQSRPLEEAFMRAAIPYQIVGGIRFYERKEVKDLLAHLKILVNPMDVPSLRRIINCRATGVGEKTLEKIMLAAESEGVPVFTYLAGAAFPDKFKPNRKTYHFGQFCAKLAAVDINRADSAVKEVVALSGLIEELLIKSDSEEEASDRIDNLHSLAARAGDFVQFRTANAMLAVPVDEDNEDGERTNAVAIDLAAFLEDVALVADIDALDDNTNKATLMTLHSAKGLEFPNVFLVGLEEGILPHRNAVTDAAVEEERRLLYVGITRARKKVWISRAEWRYMFGNSDHALPSRFLSELPNDIVDSLDFGDPLSTETGSGYIPKYKAGAFTGIDDIWDDEDLTDIDPFDEEPEHATTFKKRSRSAFPTRVPLGGSRFANVAFRAGDLVRHPNFGSGKVFSVDKSKILVQFFASGMKMLLLDNCRLTKE